MSFQTCAVFSCMLVLVAACGSSSEKANVDNTPTTNQPTEPTTPTEPVNDPVEQPLEELACTGVARLHFFQASSTADDTAQYTGENVIDSDFTAESRWSTSKSNQSVTLELNQLSLVKGLALTWLNEDEVSYGYSVELSQNNSDWISVTSDRISNQHPQENDYFAITETTARYVKIIANGNSVDSSSHLIEVEAFGCQNDVSHDIELIDWYLSIPVDESLNTKAKSIKEAELNNQYVNAAFFFNSLDGGLVFRSPIEGAKTSTNTKYTRTELREMLRSGNTSISTQGVNKNNWVFSSAPAEDLAAAGGVDGELVAELAVNHVTTTGDASQVGRVIIGQIHANDDEPIRVYYRKLPNNDKGSIYFAHEILEGEDIYYELIGTRSQSASNPADGIALNERFGYKIKVVGHALSFTITRENKADITKTISMEDSGYDIGGQYMYFKAGVYNQNNTGDSKDYVQATFYKIENSH